MQQTPRMRRNAAFEVFCLTTVYPTSTHGAHGNSGERKAGKDVFPSGKGRKCLEISGNRYSGFLWEQDAEGSNPVVRTKIPNSAYSEFGIFRLYCGDLIFCYIKRLQFIIKIFDFQVCSPLTAVRLNGSYSLFYRVMTLNIRFF